MMNNEQTKQPEPGNSAIPAPAANTGAEAPQKPDDLDKDERKPEELTPEDLRLMADTMPGEGPGDD